MRNASCLPRAARRALLPQLRSRKRGSHGAEAGPGLLKLVRCSPSLSCEREGQEQKERLSFCRVARRGQQRSGTPLSHTTWDCGVWRVSLSLNFAPWAPHLPHPSPSSVLRGPILPEGAFLLPFMEHLRSPRLLCQLTHLGFTTTKMRWVLLWPHYIPEATLRCIEADPRP